MLHTGTAVGADHYFHLRAKKHNEQSTLYSFDGYKNTRIIDPETHEYKLIDVTHETNELITMFIKNSITDSHYMSNYDLNLLKRNYHIIKEANSLYAVGFFDQDALCHVKGFTGYTIKMFVDLLVAKFMPHEPVFLPIYFFDQYSNMWYHVQYKGLNDPQGIDYIVTYSVPRPHGFYAGIGTRDLSENGKNAILQL